MMAWSYDAHLPKEAKARKAVPLYSGLIKYFPDALVAVAELSRIGNDQHNPGKPLGWDRSKSGDELDALMRHLVDAGKLDTDKVLHSTKVAWRSLANLQKELEQLRVQNPQYANDLVGQAIREHPAHNDQLEQAPEKSQDPVEYVIVESDFTKNMTRLDK